MVLVGVAMWFFIDIDLARPFCPRKKTPAAEARV
jgi:hypothetical protein